MTEQPREPIAGMLRASPSAVALTAPGQPARAAQRGPVRRLARPAAGLAAVVLFQLLFASVFTGVLHHPEPHRAPVAVVGRSPLAVMVSSHGGRTVRLVAEPTAGAGRAAIRGGQVNAAVIAGRHGESLLIQTAASPGTASVLTKEFATTAAAIKTPLQVRDLARLPASDSTGISAFFLVIAWMLGGYVGATALGIMLGGVRSPSLRHAATRLGLLAVYAAISGFLGALLIGPAMGVVSGYNLALAGVGMVLVFAAAAATAGLQAVLGMAGTPLPQPSASQHDTHHRLAGGALAPGGASMVWARSNGADDPDA